MELDLKLELDLLILTVLFGLGWYKLNSDWDSKGNHGVVGCGGHTGKWIIGYVMNIGCCTAFSAELWGILVKGCEKFWWLSRTRPL